MSDYSVLVKLGVDLTDFEAGMSEFQKRLEAISATAQNVNFTDNFSVGGLIENLKFASDALASFDKGWGILTDSVISGPEIFNKLSKALPGLGKAMADIGGLLSGLGPRLLTFATGPIGMTVAAITGTLAVLYDNIDDFIAKNPTLGRAINELSSMFEALGKVLASVWDKISGGLQTFVLSVTTLIGGLVDYVGGGITLLFSLLTGDTEKFKRAFDDITSLYKVHGSELKKGYDAIWEVDSKKAENYAAAQVEVFRQFKEAIAASLHEIDEAAKKSGSGFEANAEKARQLQASIDYLIKEGYSKESAEIQHLQVLHSEYSTAAERVREAAERKAKALREAAEAAAKLNENYRDALATFQREIELGIRVNENEASNALYEFGVLLETLKAAAKDVRIDLDSTPIVVLRDRLKELANQFVETRGENGALLVAQAELGNHLLSASNYLKQFSDGVDVSRNRIKDLAGHTGGMSPVLRNFADELNKISLTTKDGSFEQWSKQLDAARAALENARNSGTATRQEIARLAEAVKELERPMPALGKALGEMLKSGRLADILEFNSGDVLKSLPAIGKEISSLIKASPELQGKIDAVTGAFSALGQKGVDAGQKIQDFVEQGVALIPGIGGVLSGVLRAMDSVGLGLDDLGRKILNIFKKSKPADNAAEWFREVERAIREMSARGVDAGSILAYLKIQYPNISEETLAALVNGTQESFAEYNKWLASQKSFGPGNTGKVLNEWLVENLEKGLDFDGAIQAAIDRARGMSPDDFEKLFGFKRSKFGKNDEYLSFFFLPTLQLMTTKMQEFGVEFGKSWDEIIDPAEQAAIELEAAILRIQKSLDSELTSIQKKLDLGMITDAEANRAVLVEYEDAVNALIDANLTSDDPRFQEIYDTWKALGGGVRQAAGDVKSAAEIMDAEAARIAEALTKNLDQIDSLLATGTISQADAAQDKIRQYERAIEDLVRAGLKADDPRVQGMVEAWKALGGSAENASNSVRDAADAQAEAARKVQEAYDALATAVEADQEKIRRTWESGGSDGLKAMQQEAILLRDAIEEMLGSGMNPDDPRIAGWQERLGQINENLRAVGASTYEVIAPTDEVGQAWRRNAESLGAALDYIEKRQQAGTLSEPSNVLREQAEAYKRAIEDFLRVPDAMADDPRLEAWKTALAEINEQLGALGQTAVEARDKMTMAAEEIRSRLDEKLGTIDLDMKFNLPGAAEDMDLQIEKIKAQMAAINQAIIQAGGEGFDKQSEFVQGLMDMYKELFDQLGTLELAKQQETVDNMFAKTGSALATLENKYKMFGDTQQYLADKMALLKSSMQSLLDADVDVEDERMLALSAQYKAAAEAAKAYADSQKQIETAINSAIAAGGDEAATNSALIKLGEAALDLWTIVDTKVRATADDAVDWLGKWVKDVMDAFSSFMMDAQKFRETAWGDASLALDAYLTQLKVSWGQAWLAFQDLTKAITDFIEKTDYVAPVVVVFERVRDMFASMVGSWESGIVQSLSLIHRISEATQMELDKVLVYTSDLAEKMVTAFVDAARQIKGVMGEFAEIVVTFTGGAENVSLGGLTMGGVTSSLTMPSFPDDPYPGTMATGQSMLQTPTSSGSMFGQSVSQYITLEIDSRTVAQGVLRELPETARLNLGYGY